MARKRSDGFRVIKDKRSGVYLCRLWYEGKDHKVSTRARDLAEARRAGSQIYAETLSGRRHVDPPKRGPLAPIVAAWFEAIDPPIVSEGDWKRCEQTWRAQLLPRFPYIETLTPASIEDLPPRPTHHEPLLQRPGARGDRCPSGTHGGRSPA
jgi:hypothetical protein